MHVILLTTKKLKWPSVFSKNYQKKDNDKKIIILLKDNNIKDKT